MKDGTNDVIRLYIQEYVLSTNPGGFVPTILENPAGKSCILNEYVIFNGNYYKCVQTEVGEMEDDVGNLMHKRITTTFNSNGGSSVAAQTKTWNVEYITKPSDPTRTGYTFSGWFTASSGGTAISFPLLAPSSNITFYAQWNINTYTVSYNANGGSGAPSPQTKTYGVTLVLTSSVPTRSGYTFTGWNTASDGSGTAYAPGSNYTTNASDTLYAIWVINAPTAWTLVGTSTSSWAFTYDATWTYTGPLSSCPSTSVVSTQLGRAYSPGNYSFGYTFRVTVKDKYGTICNYMWFEAL